MKRVLLSMISVLFLSITYAQVPGTLSYQGILVDNAGAPVADGSHFVKFYFYNDPALEADPANLKYKSEGTGSGNQVTTYKGMFTFIIGSGSIGNDPIPTTIFSTQLYVKVIADGTALTPKIALTTVPYAMNAQNAATAQNATAMDAAGLTGTLAPARIAAGSIDNTHIADGTILAADLNGMGATANQVLQSDGTKWSPANLPAAFSTNNYIPRGNGTGMVASNIFSDGTYTGINRTTPIGASVIDVEGTAGVNTYTGMYMSGTDAASWPFYGYATGGIGKVWTYYDGSTNLWKLNANGDRLTVDGNNGNVGIGTVTTVNKLDIEGGVAIGATYSGTNAAPTNGLLVEGNVGIGTPTPSFPLDIKTPLNSSAYGLNHTDGNIIMSTYVGNGGVIGGSIGTQSNHPFFIYTANGGAKLTILPNGNVGIGTTAPTQKLHVIGNILASGTITPSDLRLKENIANLNYGLKEVLKLRPVSYTLKDNPGGKRNLGLIAQETLSITPEIIELPKNEEEFYGVNYTQLIPVLIKATQEQQAQIESLKTTIAILQTKLNGYEGLSAEVDNLKTLIGKLSSELSKPNSSVSTSNKK